MNLGNKGKAQSLRGQEREAKMKKFTANWSKGLGWAETKDKELRQDIDLYISQGIDKKTAFNMVIKGSTLGAGYIAQIRHDYEIGMFA